MLAFVLLLTIAAYESVYNNTDVIKTISEYANYLAIYFIASFVVTLTVSILAFGFAILAPKIGGRPKKIIFNLTHVVQTIVFNMANIFGAYLLGSVNPSEPNYTNFCFGIFLIVFSYNFQAMNGLLNHLALSKEND